MCMLKLSALLCGISIFLFSCSTKSVSVLSGVTHTAIDSEIFSKYISLTPSENDQSDDMPVITYSDEVTLSLKQAYSTNGSYKTEFIDRLDTSERINPVMGKHFIRTDYPEISLYYPDYQKENKMIFKFITRNSRMERFHINSVSLDFSDFCFTDGDERILFYFDGILKAALVDGSSAAPLTMNNTQLSDIISFKAHKTGDFISIFYRNSAKSLILIRFKLEGNNLSEVGSVEVAKDTLQFNSATHDNEACAIYSDSTQLVTYYEAGMYTKIGYYQDTTALLIGQTDSNQFYLISAVDTSHSGAIHYALYMLYKNARNKWTEAQITDSDIPYTALAVLDTKKNLFVASAGYSLTLSVINKKFN